jgi:YD repeat-containing protein
MRVVIPPDGGSYPYAETGYANPDAVTQIGNGVSTSTFSYDNDGNLTQKTVDGTTTTYVYDYANRLTALGVLGVLGATTTYGYDAFGTRVLQTGTTTTTIYPFKWYSVASSTGTGAKYSTTTAPKGNRNAFKHGRYSAERIEARRKIAALLGTMRTVVRASRQADAL